MRCCAFFLLNLQIVWGFGVKPLIKLPGGQFQMGINDSFHKNGEFPAYISQVKPFFISRYPVTNKEFLQFVRSKPTFVTDAESRGWSNVFGSYIRMNPVLLKDATHHPACDEEPWMVPLIAASWQRPLGPGSNIEEKWDHPVVHISKRDAAAYCFWKRMRLPSEYEWEYAARGGMKGLEYPWGDSYEMNRTNLWQGVFPKNDTGRDGYAGTSPVNAFRPQNRYDMYDIIGNVWEWTGTPFHIANRPVDGKEYQYILKGASHLDSRKGHIGEKARISTRISRILHYSSSNVGFRCAKDYKPEMDKPRKRGQKPKFNRYLFHSEL